MMSGRQLIGTVIALAGLAAAGEAPVGLNWSEGFALPPQADGHPSIGLGSPFYGAHKGVALLAGGSNFPDEPLVRGGGKRYYSDIYALLPGTTNWFCAGRLSRPAAEGVSATTPLGVVCVGGCSDGTCVSNVFLLQWDETAKRVGETPLPDFPCAMKLGGAAVRGNRVYVAGGENTETLKSDVWTLDVDVPQKGWQPLPPLPGARGRMQAQAFVQNGDQKRTFLYVVGGYAKNAQGVFQALADGYAYDLAQSPDKGCWRPISPAVVGGQRSEVGRRMSESHAPISDRRSPTSGAWPLIGAKCVTVGDQHVLFFGGLDAAYFDDNQRKMATLKGEAREAQRVAYQSATPTTWNRRVLVYHTVTDRWFTLGEVPLPPTVAGAAISLEDRGVLLATGEIRPGVRTPLCMIGQFARRKGFHPLNWAVMIAYFLGLAGMGWWFMRKRKNADDYFKGGGRIPWWAAGISIFAAMFSSITFLAVPALAYMSDWRYAPKCACIVLIPPLVIGCYLPFFRKLKLTCAYEYLELRFNLACRLFASLAFNLFMVARVAVVAYLPALAVSAATGADVNLCIVGVSLLTILYCALGGIEAVIWSDVVQGTVLFVGALFILVLLTAETDGGLLGAFHLANAAGKLRMFDWAFDFSRPVV